MSANLDRVRQEAASARAEAQSSRAAVQGMQRAIKEVRDEICGPATMRPVELSRSGAGGVRSGNAAAIGK